MTRYRLRVSTLKVTGYMELPDSHLATARAMAQAFAAELGPRWTVELYDPSDVVVWRVRGVQTRPEESREAKSAVFNKPKN